MLNGYKLWSGVTIRSTWLLGTNKETLSTATKTLIRKTDLVLILEIASEISALLQVQSSLFLAQETALQKYGILPHRNKSTNSKNTTQS